MNQEDVVTSPIHIVPLFGDQARLQIGKIAEFRLLRTTDDVRNELSEAVEWRVFVIQRNIHYLKPLSDWSTMDLVRFFPESPGNYTLAIQWRYTGKTSDAGCSGWVYQTFQVVADVSHGDRETSYTPQQVQIDEATCIWVPGEWEASLMKGYEKPVIDLLSSIIQPGASDLARGDPVRIIYDIGASLGVYSIWFSRLVGPQGRVYCIEANPVCNYFLQANLELNQARNCEILPVALAEMPGILDFTINFGNSALGITKESGFYASKTGQEIAVGSYSLDALIATFNLDSPDLIKIDIEGAEAYVISGMQDTLARCRPLILVEVHGRQAAYPTFHMLHRLGYRFQEVASGRTFENSDSLLDWFPEAVLQFLCSPPD